MLMIKVTSAVMSCVCYVGNDPATDLRGTGMLGLLQLLYMVSDPRLIPLARDIYKLSRSDEQVCFTFAWGS